MKTLTNTIGLTLGIAVGMIGLFLALMRFSDGPLKSSQAARSLLESSRRPLMTGVFWLIEARLNFRPCSQHGREQSGSLCTTRVCSSSAAT